MDANFVPRRTQLPRANAEGKEKKLPSAPESLSIFATSLNYLGPD